MMDTSIFEKSEMENDQLRSDESDQVMSKDELIQKHKKEQKDLLATITGMKKQATKKTRKSVLNKCQELQTNLDTKHQKELSQLGKKDLLNEQDDEELTPEMLLEQLTVDDVQKSQPIQETSIPITKKKRNRQKERLQKREAEIAKMKQEASIEASNTVDYRQIEIDSMNQLISMNQLEMVEIKPDGHCLFASIQDQLQHCFQISKSIQELRQLSADYILDNKDDFIPFLFDETTMQIRDVDEYCNELVNTAMWGSDMEILALAKTFNCPVHVYMAGASTIKINEENDDDETKEPMKLGYYKHSFGLGEHYNSLRLVL